MKSRPHNHRIICGTSSSARPSRSTCVVKRFFYTSNPTPFFSKLLHTYYPRRLRRMLLGARQHQRVGSTAHKTSQVAQPCRVCQGAYPWSVWPSASCSGLGATEFLSSPPTRANHPHDPMAPRSLKSIENTRPPADIMYQCMCPLYNPQTGADVPCGRALTESRWSVAAPSVTRNDRFSKRNFPKIILASFIF